MAKPVVRRHFGSVPRYWVTRLGLVAFGVALATAIIWGALRLGLVSGLTAEGRTVDYGEITYTVGMGDLFVSRKGKIAPPPDPYLVLSRHRLAYDSDGFRLPAQSTAIYPIVALGDSITEAPIVAFPWPDVLAAENGIPVQNLGFIGYGPFEEAHTLKDYALKYAPRLIIVSFFEGNDLSNAVSVNWQPAYVAPAVARRKIAAPDPRLPNWVSDNLGPYQFPVKVDLAGKTQDMAFLDSYAAWLTAPLEDYQASENIKALTRALQEMVRIAATAPEKPCVLLTYFPSKEHLYVPYITPAQREQAVATVQLMYRENIANLIVPDHDKWASFDNLLSRINNHRDAVAAAVHRVGMPFLDLTPAFQEAARQGDVLFYVYDTHPNQAGHTLAGKVIAGYLKGNPNPCSK